MFAGFAGALWWLSQRLSPHAALIGSSDRHMLSLYGGLGLVAVIAVGSLTAAVAAVKLSGLPPARLR